MTSTPNPPLLPLESSDQLAGTPAPTPVMKVNGRGGAGREVQSSDHPGALWSGGTADKVGSELRVR